MLLSDKLRQFCETQDWQVRKNSWPPRTSKLSVTKGDGSVQRSFVVVVSFAALSQRTQCGWGDQSRAWMTPKRAGSLMTAFRSPGLGSAKMTATSSALYTDRSNADYLNYDKNASRGHGRRKFKDTIPLMSSLLFIFVRGGEPIL
jgi:hypothetical protein